jgi:hypothetical protein
MSIHAVAMEKAFLLPVLDALKATGYAVSRINQADEKSPRRLGR